MEKYPEAEWVKCKVTSGRGSDSNCFLKRPTDASFSSSHLIISINSLALVLARFCFEHSAKMASISTELSSAADSSGLQNESSALIVASTLAGNKYVFGSTGYSVVTQSPKEYGWSQLCFASQHQREYFRCKPCEIHLGRSWSPDKTKQNSILGKHSSNERRKKIGNVKVDGALLTKALLQSRMMDFPYMLEWQRRQELLERCLVIVVHCLWHLLKSCPVFFDRLRREQVRKNYSACSKK